MDEILDEMIAADHDHDDGRDWDAEAEAWEFEQALTFQSELRELGGFEIV